MNQEILTVAKLSRILTNHEEPFYNKNGEVFRFENILIDERIELSGIVKNIAFGENCIFNKPVVFNNLNIETISFFNGCTFNDTLEIYLSKSIISLSISDCHFAKNLIVSNVETNYLNINNSSFLKNIELNDVTINHISRINNISCEESIKIKNCRFKTNLEMGVFPFEDPNKIKFKVKCFIAFNFDNLRIGDSFSSSEIEEIYFEKKLSVGGNSSIRNIKCSLLSFKQFENEGRLLINNLSPIHEKTAVKIINSDLGNAIFQDCDLSLSSILIQSSIIKSIQFNNIKLPEPECINEGVEINGNLNLISIAKDIKKIFENSGDFSNATKFHLRELLLHEKNIAKENFKEKKDIYSQLKKMYDQRGDSVKSLEYQAKELEIHMNSPEISWSERLNLQFAYWSNNFGTDWVKAIKFLIIGAAYFYFLVILSQNCEFENSWNTVWGLLSGFFEFLNPLRKLNSLTINGNEEILNNKARIADFFARIFIAFAEYQLIQAFRKYGKK